MNKFKLCLGALVAVGIGNGGCGVKKNLDEMHDATMEMAATTKRMAETTEGMAGTTQGMSGTTDGMSHTTGNMYDDSRMALGRQARADALADIKRQSDIGAKLGSASEFYASEEYQMWKPNSESADARLVLMDIAVQDYFHKVREFIKDRSDTGVPIIQDEDAENLFAMAGAMHYENQKQLDALAGTNIPVVNMYTMIADGLRAASAVQSGQVDLKSVPNYQKQVRIFKRDAIYMLQVRQNFLRAFAYILMTNTKEGNQSLEVHSFKDMFKVKNIKSISKVLMTRLFGKDWVPNFANRDLDEINFDAEVLEFACETRELLKEIGETPAGDKNIDPIYKNIDFKSSYRTIRNNTDAESVLKMKAIGRVMAAVQRLNQK